MGYSVVSIQIFHLSLTAHVDILETSSFLVYALRFEHLISNYATIKKSSVKMIFIKLFRMRFRRIDYNNQLTNSALLNFINAKSGKKKSLILLYYFNNKNIVFELNQAPENQCCLQMLS